MTGVGDDSRDRSATKPWLAVGFLLAIGATLALVLTDDLRWIRLAVVAALWAALIGALMAAKYRKQAALNEKSVTKAQKIYELELQKEIAARREHELEVEAETRQRIEAERRDELEALREELRSLRDNLQNLFGGEVLWERVALTAQSTRMRKLGDDQRLVTANEAAGGRPAITVGADSADPADALDSPTEMIDRVQDLDAEPAEDQADEPVVARAEHPRRREPGRPRSRFVPRPSRPAEDSGPTQKPADPPTRRVQPRPGAAMARASEAASRARAEMSRPHQRPVARPGGKPTSAYSPHRAPESEPSSTPVERSRPAITPVKGAVARSLDPGGTPPTRETRPAVEEAPTRTQRPVDARTAVTPPVGGRPGKPPVRRGTPDAPATEVRKPVEAPRRAPAEPEPVESAVEATVAERAQVPAPVQPEPNATLPTEIGGARRSGGRKRRTEPDDAAPASGGGRRYRADDEEPAWMSAVPSGGSRHSRSAADSAADSDAEGPASSGGRRRAPESSESDAEPAGSHAEGRSVSELLAAYGASGSTPRRRRRAAD
ncbi:DUF6779 domain-containing protein [Saccharomonospora cyanea]|uniref:HAMP domain-containing protein n=1 Tax=Saccharomonospora cyanea NA-134 TaxID=882082 RepID=H5XK62_9PSEU|nr:DUF6779 domain-containing protein [Saccharomonospora cyanea]EHR63497.1 hypothetical protein SaccyDRAFT_4690 [Saccharomonospora cyanea NA-134]